MKSQGETRILKNQKPDSKIKVQNPASRQQDDIQKHYQNILAPSRNIDDLMQSLYKFTPNKSSRMQTVEPEEQDLAVDLQIEDLIVNNKSVKLEQPTHLQSTMERQSQDAGYFATGQEELAVQSRGEDFVC